MYAIAVTIAFQSTLLRGTMSCNKISHCPRAISTSRRNRISSLVFRPCMRSGSPSHISFRCRRERERLTKKTQGDVTTRDPCEGSRGDDFSRVQKCARHSGIMPASLSLRWMGHPVARNQKQRGAGPRKRRGGEGRSRGDREEKEGRERG